MIDRKESFREDFESRNSIIDQKLQVLNKVVGKNTEVKTEDQEIAEQLIALNAKIQEGFFKERKEYLNEAQINLLQLLEKIIDFMILKLSNKIDTQNTEIISSLNLGDSTTEREQNLAIIRESVPSLYESLASLAKDSMDKEVVALITEDNPPPPIKAYLGIMKIFGQEIV